MDIIGAEVLEKMNENPKEAGKFTRFFEEKGFYIILFLCVAAIGIAGYVLFFDPANTTDDDSALLSETDGTVEANTDLGGGVIRPGNEAEEVDLDVGTEVPVSGDSDAATSDSGAATSSDDAATSGNDAATSGNDAVEATTGSDETPIDGDAVIRDAVETISSGRKEEPESDDTQQQTQDGESGQDTAPTFFVRPVTGEVLREFSGDELVYDRTMGDWRTHNGVDFLAADGTLVSVIADGTIEDVYRDEYYGTGVLVNHGGGLKSVYLGLIENATVTVGQEVAAGETIGAVSTSALFESLEQAHLHVEMSLDGERVNPLDYIPE